MGKLFIKNMVCDRCIQVVRQILERNGVNNTIVELGEVEYQGVLSNEKLDLIKIDLENEGFEILTMGTPILVSKIKSALINLFNKDEISEDFKLSTFLTVQFPYDYSHLSRVFSHHEGDTIEHYLIRLRIEKAKELLRYSEENISEVAYRLGYASIAHFSRQFKKVVGVSPSIYRDKPNRRNSLEDV